MTPVAVAGTSAVALPSATPEITIVVPTFNERENLARLVDRILGVTGRKGIEAAIIVVDDGSPDGTGEIADEIAKREPRVSVLHRTGRRGLSSALLDGFGQARSEIVCAMDADASHPPEALSDMVARMRAGADFVIGSRYVEGGRTEEWPMKRRIISRGATILARPFTNVKDPLSGFFAIRKTCIEGVGVKGRGYKLCLEFLVRARHARVEEVPITFVDREHGRSKLKPSDYAFFVADLLDYLGTAGQWLRFMAVGTLGGTFYFAIIWALTQIAQAPYSLAGAVAFAFAVTHNYVLNKVWTFREEVHDRFGGKFARFFALATAALGVNVTLLHLLAPPLGGVAATIVAIAAASVVNYLGSRWWAFRRSSSGQSS